MTMRSCAAGLCAGAAIAAAAPSMAQDIRIPVLAPITGFLSLEGTSQRNGAVMALEDAPEGVAAQWDVTDTGVSPEAAVTAFERALGGDPPVAVVAPMLGTQMLALLPLAEEYQVPLITVSGTAAITEQGNMWIFRFFPGDAVVKAAHARFAVEDLGVRRPAIIYQTTAYGQSGRAHLAAAFAELGVAPALEEGLAVDVREMLPVLVKAQQSGADALILHLHSGPTALLIRQARAIGLDLPIIAGSAMHQPATAALLAPEELAGVCAETGSSPISGGSDAIARWAADYEARFDAPPDAFALAQYDGVRMALAAAAAGADTPAAMRDWLAANAYDGLAMTYRSDGSGDMAHDAVIICYDGTSRIPAIVRRFENVDGAF